MKWKEGSRKITWIFMKKERIFETFIHTWFMMNIWKWRDRVVGRIYIYIIFIVNEWIKMNMLNFNLNEIFECSILFYFNNSISKKVPGSLPFHSSDPISLSFMVQMFVKQVFLTINFIIISDIISNMVSIFLEIQIFFTQKTWWEHAFDQSFDF
jgi:hypothetical protein